MMETDAASAAVGMTFLKEPRQLPGAPLNITPTSSQEIPQPKCPTDNDEGSRKKSLRVRFSTPRSDGQNRRLRSPSPELRPSPMHTKSADDSRMAAGLNRLHSFDSYSPQGGIGGHLQDEEPERPSTRCHDAKNGISYDVDNFEEDEEEREDGGDREEEATLPPNSIRVNGNIPIRRKRSECTQLKASTSMAPPKAKKRITRQPERYQSHPSSARLRKRNVSRRHTMLRENGMLNEEDTVEVSSKSGGSVSSSTQPKFIQTKAVNKKVETAKKVSTSGSKLRKNQPMHGASCWNNVCDCVLLDLLRSQPLVTLLEEKGKVVKIAIDPEAKTTGTNGQSEKSSSNRRTRNVRVDSKTTEC
ncbi:hypothetical protein V3C99_005155 [Haemonchus contortus]|uniref:Uncharacterized protein n=1 Tax=Haemonchus contortus TaxID=6289 RepID=A0A7I4XVM2_HAECO